jgi:hypothetical protein
VEDGGSIRRRSRTVACLNGKGFAEAAIVRLQEKDVVGGARGGGAWTPTCLGLGVGGGRDL